MNLTICSIDLKIGLSSDSSLFLKNRTWAKFSTPSRMQSGSFDSVVQSTDASTIRGCSCASKSAALENSGRKLRQISEPQGSQNTTSTLSFQAIVSSKFLSPSTKTFHNKIPQHSFSKFSQKLFSKFFSYFSNFFSIYLYQYLRRD